MTAELSIRSPGSPPSCEALDHYALFGRQSGSLVSAARSELVTLT